MLLNNKIKKLPRIMGGGGNLFFKCKLSPITSSGDKSVMSITNNKYSAFSLIELSIVLIIMGLLVAGITGGASLIDNARLSSFKREADDHIRDVFTFYARVGRLPGDLDNTGRIGYTSGGSLSTASSYADPYNKAGITITSGPFVDLYLHGVSSFQPTPPTATATAVTTALTHTNVKTIANGGGLPFSKVYKDFVYVHRYESDSAGGGSVRFNYGMFTKTALGVFLTDYTNAENKKTVDIAKKMDTKFDDGAYNEGNIRGYCGSVASDSSIGSKSYTVAVICSEMFFYFDVK
jgi:hypothetical protein